MANELYTRTNQKIYFAGLSLEALGRAEQGKEMNAIALTQAGREAALFHLYGALLGLCHEIAGYYRLPQAGALRAELIMTRDVLESMAIPELAELVEMTQSPDSWIARLLKAHADMFQPPRVPHVPKGDVTQPLIVAISLEDDEPKPLSREELESWRQELKKLALRFREGLNEC
ncbi:DUF6586 family protein [Pseudomonas trivialis]|uniref:PasA protein n=1 Tax=Pseudomonas trivialis TaxID=200450 RepID=A0A0R2ZMZ4_9PSED|nr:DUF6586 family protein [Pseudomonas trivialis]KRP58430.1 PasA protein [Pseudomonas trivialis]SDS55642.1 hypothetical protein SAMN04490205_2859 [Pseudomonas trivialis]